MIAYPFILIILCWCAKGLKIIACSPRALKICHLLLLISHKRQKQRWIKRQMTQRSSGDESRTRNKVGLMKEIKAVAMLQTIEWWFQIVWASIQKKQAHEWMTHSAPRQIGIGGTTTPHRTAGLHRGECWWWRVWCHVISIFIPYVWSRKRAALIIMATWCSKRDETWGRGVWGWMRNFKGFYSHIRKHALSGTFTVLYLPQTWNTMFNNVNYQSRRWKWVDSC